MYLAASYLSRDESARARSSGVDYVNPLRARAAEERAERQAQGQQKAQQQGQQRKAPQKQEQVGKGPQEAEEGKGEGGASGSSGGGGAGERNSGAILAQFWRTSLTADPSSLQAGGGRGDRVQGRRLLWSSSRVRRDCRGRRHVDGRQGAAVASACPWPHCCQRDAARGGDPPHP